MDSNASAQVPMRPLSNNISANQRNLLGLLGLSSELEKSENDLLPT